ncbi:nitrous oxide reductase accessory protein NosL [Sulfurimonas sp.]|uniref:nitrous oxide reductase accessory protein NosL n=1 Tax=Sulfurimonas sp. TaxID=2022749 RepID=UPI003562BD1D
MIKKTSFSIAVSLFLLSGCADTNTMHSHNKIFQSVNYEQAQLVQDGKNKQYCVKCGMDLVRFYKTSHAATSEQGNKNYQYCSIHCLEDHLGEGMVLKNPKVVDVESLKLISVAKATYVVGSSVRGTMSRISKYAFLKKQDALKFQEKNGGEIMDFNSALEKAKEDFKHYR